MRPDLLGQPGGPRRRLGGDLVGVDEDDTLTAERRQMVGGARAEGARPDDDDLGLADQRRSPIMALV
jgi:hypothetical protein